MGTFIVPFAAAFLYYLLLFSPFPFIIASAMNYTSISSLFNYADIIDVHPQEVIS